MPARPVVNTPCPYCQDAGGWTADDGWHKCSCRRVPVALKRIQARNALDAFIAGGGDFTTYIGGMTIRQAYNAGVENLTDITGLTADQVKSKLSGYAPGW